MKNKKSMKKILCVLGALCGSKKRVQTTKDTKEKGRKNFVTLVVKKRLYELPS